MEEQLEKIIKMQAKLIDELYLRLVTHEVIERPLTDNIEDIARKIYEVGIEL